MRRMVDIRLSIVKGVAQFGSRTMTSVAKALIEMLPRMSVWPASRTGGFNAAKWLLDGLNWVRTGSWDLALYLEIPSAWSAA